MEKPAAVTDVVLRGSQAGLWVLAVVNLVVVSVSGWRWAQGDPSWIVRAMAVVFSVLLLLKLAALRRPPEARLRDGRLTFRLGPGMECSTPRANVALLEVEDGRLRVRFEDLAKVDAGPMLRKVFEDNQARGGVHFRIPMRPDPAALQRLRAAVFAGR